MAGYLRVLRFPPPLVYWGLTPQQQPGSYQGGEMMMMMMMMMAMMTMMMAMMMMMMMKSVFWWREPEYPEETTDLRQVTDETVHTYGLCPVCVNNFIRGRRCEQFHQLLAVGRWFPPGTPPEN